jgi:SynChlorMet cassette protein ScmC
MVNQINRAMTSNRPLPAHNWKVQDVERLRFLFHDDVQDIICDIGGKDEKILEIIKMRGFLFPIYERTSNRGGLPLHGALIEMGRKGVVLAAPGGKGKSTCCRRLPPPWHFLCDDETLVLRDHPKQYLAHPFPTWSEYILHQSERTWNVQRYLPLCAVFFLEQSETDEVVPLGQGQAAAFMNGSSMQVYHQRAIFLSREEERALKKRLFDNACELARAIPAYILRASLRGGFWEKMEEVFK